MELKHVKTIFSLYIPYLLLLQTDMTRTNHQPPGLPTVTSPRSRRIAWRMSSDLDDECWEKTKGKPWENHGKNGD